MRKSWCGGVIMDSQVLMDTFIFRVQTVISNIIRICFLAGVFIPVLNGNWMVGFLSFTALCLSFLPAYLEKSFRIFLPLEFEIMFLAFLCGTLFLGEAFEFYLRFSWWDIALHGLSGIMLGWVGFILLFVLSTRERLQASPFLLGFFSFCFAMALGGLWEIFEFGMDQTFGLNMQKSGLNDTMGDLIVDCIGAFFASMGGYFYIKYHQRSLFRRMVESFFQKNPWMFTHLS